MTVGAIVNESQEYDEGSFILVLWETSLRLYRIKLGQADFGCRDRFR